MTELNSIDFAADVVARFRRGELQGEQAAAVKEFLANLDAIWFEMGRAERERAREEKRAELARQADNARASAARAAAEEQALRDAMNHC